MTPTSSRSELLSSIAFYAFLPLIILAAGVFVIVMHHVWFVMLVRDWIVAKPPSPMTNEQQRIIESYGFTAKDMGFACPHCKKHYAWDDLWFRITNRMGFAMREFDLPSCKA